MKVLLLLITFFFSSCSNFYYRGSNTSQNKSIEVLITGHCLINNKSATLSPLKIIKDEKVLTEGKTDKNGNFTILATIPIGSYEIEITLKDGNKKRKEFQVKNFESDLGNLDF